MLPALAGSMRPAGGSTVPGASVGVPRGVAVLALEVGGEAQPTSNAAPARPRKARRDIWLQSWDVSS